MNTDPVAGLDRRAESVSSKSRPTATQAALRSFSRRNAEPICGVHCQTDQMAGLPSELSPWTLPLFRPIPARLRTAKLEAYGGLAFRLTCEMEPDAPLLGATARLARWVTDDVPQFVKLDEVVSLAAKLVGDYRRQRTDRRDNRQPHTRTPQRCRRSTNGRMSPFPENSTEWSTCGANSLASTAILKSVYPFSLRCDSVDATLFLPPKLYEPLSGGVSFADTRVDNCDVVGDFEPFQTLEPTGVRLPDLDNLFRIVDSMQRRQRREIAHRKLAKESTSATKGLQKKNANRNALLQERFNKSDKTLDTSS